MTNTNHHEWQEPAESSRRQNVPTTRRIDSFLHDIAPDGGVESRGLQGQVSRELSEGQDAISHLDFEITLIIRVSPRSAERIRQELGITGDHNDLTQALEGNGLISREARDRFHGSRESRTYGSRSPRVREAKNGLMRFNPSLARRFTDLFGGMIRDLDDAYPIDAPERLDRPSRSIDSSRREYRRRARGLLRGNYFEPSTREHINQMGGQKYLEEQERLKDYYADQIEDGFDDRFSYLRGNPDYERISGILGRRQNHYWSRDPGMRYGDLAWGRSQLEALERGIAQRSTVDSIPGDALKTLRFPATGHVSEGRMRIAVPEEYRLPGEDGSFGVNDPRDWKAGIFWGGRGETYARDAGIRFKPITYADGAVRGTQIEFTKPGRYIVNGKVINVTEDQLA